MCDDKTSRPQRLTLLRSAGRKHQNLYKDSMNGEGVMEHINALTVLSRRLGHKSDFLESIIKKQWSIRSSQQPQRQMYNNGAPDLNIGKLHRASCPGGGFGPPDEGYTISYMLPTKFNIFFHVTSKHSCAETNSQRFAKLITQSMLDMTSLLNDASNLQLKMQG